MGRAVLRSITVVVACLAVVVGVHDPFSRSFLSDAGAAAVSRSARESGTTLHVRIAHPLAIRRWPRAGRVIGWMPDSSRYYHQPIEAWVLRTALNGRYGRVPVPYAATHRQGWIDLRGLKRTRTGVRVNVDLSRHLVVARRRGHVVLRTHAATGSPVTPTPRGRYFVTDRVAFWRGSVYGSFAFGISGVQSHLPLGWSGGNQLAIHGTNEPWSIGRSVSAGCLRVSEKALRKLKLLLRLGTPVVISP